MDTAEVTNAYCKRKERAGKADHGCWACHGLLRLTHSLAWQHAKEEAGIALERLLCFARQHDGDNKGHGLAFNVGFE
eukprot:scaffold228395_cov11-Tisochrysis_lutea.AAC.1